VIAAVVPVKSWEQGKSRLSEVLGPREREKLSRAMMVRTVGVLLRTPNVGEVVVVTPAGNVLPELPGNVHRVADPGGGLNRAVECGIATAIAEGAEAALIVPIDLPLLSAPAIDRLIGEIRSLRGPRRVAIAPDRHRSGTNALLCMPPDLIPPKFGVDSFRHHLHLAETASAEMIVSADPAFGVDLDTPDDISHLQPQSIFELGLAPALQGKGATAMARINEG
jgi:2-phospho-L-lactate guanylyltransferase